MNKTREHLDMDSLVKTTARSIWEAKSADGRPAYETLDAKTRSHLGGAILPAVWHGAKAILDQLQPVWIDTAEQWAALPVGSTAFALNLEDGQTYQVVRIGSGSFASGTLLAVSDGWNDVWDVSAYIHMLHVPTEVPAEPDLTDAR